MSTFYGQFDTDKIATTYFSRTGNAIEVGAAHGIASSNTLHFENYGWKVLCIEPNPDMFYILQRCRKNWYQAAVSDYDKDNVDFNIVRLVNGDESAISGLTIDEKLLESHKSVILSRKTIKVKVRKLDSILVELNLFSSIDYLSVDTEGTELEVFKGFDIDKWKPKLIISENNHDTNDVRDYLKDFGYVLDRRVVINDFFIRSDNSYPVC